MTAAVDYGYDLSCPPSGLDPAGRCATGAQLMREAIARRLSCPRGALIGCPDYGIELRSFLGRGINPTPNSSDLGRIRAAIITEVLRDERIQSVSVGVTYTLATQILSVSIVASTALGPFSLVLDVSKVTITLLDGNV